MKTSDETMNVMEKFARPMRFWKTAAQRAHNLVSLRKKVDNVPIYMLRIASVNNDQSARTR